MDQIGVLLVEGQRRILSDIVQDLLEADASVELVGRVGAIAEATEAVAQHGCDAVVWMLGDDERAVEPAALLRRHPRLRVLAVEAGGREGCVWWMRPHRTPLGNLTPAAIVEELHHRP